MGVLLARAAALAARTALRKEVLRMRLLPVAAAARLFFPMEVLLGLARLVGGLAFPLAEVRTSVPRSSEVGSPGS